MMPLGAPSISKYGSLVRPNTQIVALRAHCALHCARTALEAPPRGTPSWDPGPPPWVGGPYTKKKFFRTQVQIHTQRPQYAKKF